MSLIKCNECSSSIGSEAKRCPKCGAPVPKRTSILTWIAASVFALSIYSCVTKKDEVVGTSKISALSNANSASKSSASLPTEDLPVFSPEPGDKWQCVNRAGVTYFVKEKPLDDVCGLILKNCNKASANKIKKMMSTLGTYVDKNVKLEFHWSPSAISDITNTKAESTMRVMADADACLIGYAREIRYYRYEDLWAVASPSSGFMMMK